MKILKRFLTYLVFACIFFGSAAPQTDKKDLVWPPPPQQARIKHLQTISSLKDVSEEPGFFTKVFNFLFGSKQTTQWLVQPVGIAISKNGQIYIADPGSKCVHILDLKKKEYQYISETKYGVLNSPVGIAFAPNGVFYISDSERGEIIAFDSDNNADFIIKTNLLRPTGLYLINNKLYVIDTGLHKVVVFDLQGNFLYEFGKRGSGDGEFNFPVQLTAKNSLYIVDALNYRIQNFDFEGKSISSFGQIGNAAGSFANPKAIALDSDGDIYVTDALMDNFQIFDNNGQLLLIVGTKGNADGEFMSPSGIAIDDDDTIYIVDSLNRRIQIFKYLK